MWRWLPSVLCNKSLGCLSERRLFFLQLIGIVFGIHFAIFVLYGLVGWVQSGHDRYKISLTQSGATYVLMPLQKKVDQKNRKINIDEARAFKKSNVIDHETYKRKKNARKKSKSAIIEKKSVAKNKSATKTMAQQKKQQASVMVQSSKMQISKKQTAKSKKSKINKSVTKIQDEVKQPEIEQPKESSVEQVAAVVPVQTASVIEPEVVESIDVADIVETEAVMDDFDEDNVIFVGYEELDQSMIGSKIQHEIQQNWTPPVGMRKDIVCEVRVKIGSDGEAVETKVNKSSGVFVYDSCAKKTLQKIEYPKEVWNKTITILLGSS
ncbi:TonB C-terminal domain-containing protein [Candidatus Babeliales bacterium]|nr:TonB C-terminal domain-containing protein [Candidatus Babeliales bacterium]